MLPNIPQVNIPFATKDKNAIQSPKHYQDTKLMDLLMEKEVPFAEGNIMKYVFRWKEKDGLKDLYKARDYLNALITHAELNIHFTPTNLNELK